MAAAKPRASARLAGRVAEVAMFADMAVPHCCGWRDGSTRKWGQFCGDRYTQLQAPATQLQAPATQLQSASYKPATSAFRPATSAFRPATSAFRPATSAFRPATSAFRPRYKRLPARYSDTASRNRLRCAAAFWVDAGGGVCYAPWPLGGWTIKSTAPRPGLTRPRWKETFGSGNRSRQQRRPSPARAEEENAARRRLARNENAPGLRKTLRETHP